MSDTDLIARALSGEQDAYTELYRRTLPRMKGVAFQYLRNVGDLESHAHDFTAHILMRLEKFDGASRYTTWATTVGINKALEILRQGRAQSRTATGGTVYLDEAMTSTGETDEAYRDVPDHHRPFEQVDARIDAERILSRLPKRQRDALVRYTYMGEKHDGALEPHSKSKANIYRAKQTSMKVISQMSDYPVRDSNFSLPGDGDTPELAAPIVVDKLAMYDLIPGIKVYGVPPNGSLRRPVLKTCHCPCGQQFYAFTPAAKFIPGHRLKPVAKAGEDHSKDFEVNVSVSMRDAQPAPGTTTPAELIDGVEMVSLTIPASALDRFFALMPTETKRKAVEQFLGAL